MMGLDRARPGMTDTDGAAHDEREKQAHDPPMRWLFIPMLICAALHHRHKVSKESRPEVSKEARAEVPVPVMFTLHGWDPRAQCARDWLARRHR